MTITRLLARLLPACAIAFALVGCMDGTTLVKIRRDGSGTVQVRVTANQQYATMLQKQHKGQLYDQAALQKRAEAMNCTFVGVKQVTRANGWQGWVAEYAFEDVNDLVISGQDVNPDDMAALPVRMATGYKFDYKVTGRSNTLTIIPEVVGSDSVSDAPPTESEIRDMRSRFATAGAMLKGAKFNVLVAVDGIVVESDAHYRSQMNPNMVLLSEVQFDEFLGPQGLGGWNGESAITDGFAGYRAQLEQATLVVE